MTKDILLTGTPVVTEPMRTVQAGSLEAVYDAGSLRWVRWNGVEILRGILFLVRTPGWGTPPATISGLDITDTATGFTITYDAHFGPVGAGVAVAISITGDAKGSLHAGAKICAEVPFETNRSGFVILHPLDGFAGTKVHVDHASAPAQDRTISLDISPGQPVMDMRAITHRPTQGLEVKTAFAGDIFEMEDHRNWTDASFKTYNRPIGLPYPYLLSPDQPIEQSITVTVQDDGADTLPQSAIKVPDIAGQRMPRFALPLDTVAYAAHALEFADQMAGLSPASLLLRVDLSADLGDEDYNCVAQLIEKTGADLELQVIVSTPDTTGMEDDLRALSEKLSEAGIAVSRIAAFAKIDEQSFQPGQDRPAHPSETALADALTRFFPKASKIGGTPAFFTEFNRKRPAPSLWEGMTFATSPVVHAADDASVMETLQSLPHVLSSATALSGGLPISVGPVGIGMRLNPYAGAPAENDALAREEMAARDPRQRGLFAAAWTVGYLTRIAPFAIDQFAFGAPTGPFGLISSAQDYARPYWDDRDAGALYPLYHVARWIAAAAGAQVLRADTNDNVACLIWQTEAGRSALIANLSPERRDVPSTGLSNPIGVFLDASSLADPLQDPTPLETAKSLDAYAVLYLGEAT